MIDPSLLAGNFARDDYVVGRLTEDLTHEDSLRVPPSGGNCLNWLLGHILVSRNTALAALGLEPVAIGGAADRYRTGTAPISEAEAVNFGDLLADLRDSGARIGAALRERGPDDMAAVHGETTVGELLLGLSWHETYHTGQLELLRRLAGKTEKVFG